ncbi:MAG: ABC transporter substrate-binding protein, partial [Halobaculum sp.]
MTDDTLYRMNGPIRTLDPVQTTTSSGTRVVSQMYETLFEYDYAADGSVTTAPHLVDEQVESTGTTRVYELRDDVTFSNGESLTAPDVVYTLERVAASPSSVRSWLLLDVAGVAHETDDGEYVPGSLDVTARDDRTVVIQLAEPFHGLEGVLADVRFSIVPEGQVDDVPGVDGAVSQETFAREPVGTGPFELEAFDPDHEWSPTAEQAQHWVPPTDDPDEELVLRAREAYREPCSLDAIHYRVADIEQRHELAHAGKSEEFYVRRDYVQPEALTVDHTDEYGRRYGTYGPMPESGLTADYLGVPYPRTHLLVFDTERVPAAVRRAVAYAVDQETLATGPRHGRVEPAAFLTPPGLFPGGRDGYERERAASYPYDAEETLLAEARESVAELGHDSTDPYPLTIEGEPYREETCEWLAEELTAANVDAEFVASEFDELRDRRSEGVVDVSIITFDMDYDAPDGFLRAVVPGEDVLGTNWSGTAAADRAVAAWDRLQATRGHEATAARSEAVLDVEAAIHEDLPVLPLYHFVGERFSQQWVSFPDFGPESRNRQR